MTIPSLITKIQDYQFKVAAKHAFSTAHQAFLSMKEDGASREYYLKNTMSFKTDFMKYFKIAQDCGLNSCVPTSYQSEIYKDLYGNKANAALLDEGQFYTMDGQFWMIQNSQFYDWIWISVDVNGYNSKPNVWGRDLFTFWVDENFNLKPMGSADSYYPVPNSCNRNIELKSSTGAIQGIGCMKYVMDGIKY